MVHSDLRHLINDMLAWPLAILFVKLVIFDQHEYTALVKALT